MDDVAFQGEHGAYSELAAFNHFGRKVQTSPCRTFRELFERVERSHAAYGMVPVENSTAGDVNENYDLLLEKNLVVCGEEYLPVHHCLIGQKGSGLKDIRRAYSHPQALVQSQEFLDRNSIQRIEEYDTAGAVRIVKERGNKEEAAVASELAAEIYGMKMLRKRIETDSGNTTRFFVVAREQGVAGSRELKTSVVFSVKHTPGSLYCSLRGLAENNINLTKLVSRPMKGKKWEYMFYLDFEGSLKDGKVKNAIAELRKNALFMKILGSYPKGKDF
ncbi:prephenate dehydratase [Candidatus Woesearchaeota archaeon]|nr:prephenate dehydratase [Candidatus Woesearchaeota archaeon]